MSLWTAPHHVSDNILELEEVDRRLEKLQAEMHSHAGLAEESLTSETSLNASSDLPCGGLSVSPILDSDHHPANSPPASFPSFPSTPEYIAGQEEDGQTTVASTPFQGDIILDQDELYAMVSGDSVQLENQPLPLAPPDYTSDIFPQHSLATQHPQNVRDAWEVTNALGGMDYEQPMVMTSYTPSSSNIDNTSILVQPYEIKLMPVLVPTTNPYIIHTQYTPLNLPTMSEFTPHRVPRLIMQAAAVPSMDDFIPAGQHHRGFWSSNATSIVYPDTFLASQPDIYVPQDQQLAMPPACYCSGIGRVLDRNPAVHINEYEPVF